MPPTTKGAAAEWKPPARKWFELPVKIILSGLAVYFFSLVLHLMQSWYATSALLNNAADNPATSARPVETPVEAAGVVGIFWPQFPGSSKSTVHRMSLNGVEAMGEDWQTAVAGAEEGGVMERKRQ